MNAMPSQGATPSQDTTQTHWQPSPPWQVQDKDFQLNQQMTSQWEGQFTYALDESSITISFQGSGSVSPGELSPGTGSALSLDGPDARAAAVVAYQVDIEPMQSQTQEFSGDQLSSITLGNDRSPQTANQITQQTTSFSVQNDSSFGINAGFQGDMPMVGISAGVSNSSGSGTSDTVSTTDWGVTDNADLETRAASWLFRQQSPYDAQAVYADFGTLWQQAFEDDGSVKEFPDFSTNTISLQVTATWEVDRSLIEAIPGKTLYFRLKDSISAGGVYSPNYQPPDGDQPSWKGHHELWSSSSGNTWVQAIDLSELLSGQPMPQPGLAAQPRIGVQVPAPGQMPQPGATTPSLPAAQGQQDGYYAQQPGQEGQPPQDGYYAQQPGQEGQPPQDGYYAQQPGQEGQPPQDGYYAQQPGQEGQPPQDGYYAQQPGQEGQPPQDGYYAQQPGQEGQPPQDGYYAQQPGQEGQPPQDGYYAQQPGQEGQPPQDGYYAQQPGQEGQPPQDGYYAQQPGQEGQPPQDGYYAQEGQEGQPPQGW